MRRFLNLPRPANPRPNLSWQWGQSRGDRQRVCSEHARSLSFGSSADRVGPVALRPRLAAGLPFRRIPPASTSHWMTCTAAECSSRSMIPPTHASVRANADTGAARKIRTFQPVDDEPWSNQVMTSTPRVHVHSETPRLCDACHEHGTTLNGFLPVSWPLTNYRSSADPVVACRSAVSIAERSAVLPTAPTREGGNHRKGTPTPWRSAVVRSPQQLVQYQVVTARVAQCREFAVLEHVIQIGEFVPNRARPVELIAELLQRHPLHRLPHDTTVIASPRIHLPSVAEPNQIRLRIGLRDDQTAVSGRHMLR